MGIMLYKATLANIQQGALMLKVVLAMFHASEYLVSCWLVHHIKQVGMCHHL